MAKKKSRKLGELALFEVLKQIWKMKRIQGQSGYRVMEMEVQLGPMTNVFQKLNKTQKRTDEAMYWKEIKTQEIKNLIFVNRNKVVRVYKVWGSNMELKNVSNAAAGLAN